MVYRQIAQGDDAQLSSLSTGSVGIDGANLISKGDVLPIATWGTRNNKSLSTTSTTFTAAGDLMRFVGNWDDLTPDNSDIVVAMSCQVFAGSGETADFRLYNQTDGESVTEATGVDGDTWLPWSTYSPTTTSSETVYVFEARTNPGSTSSSFYKPNVHLGVQL